MNGTADDAQDDSVARVEDTVQSENDHILCNDPAHGGILVTCFVDDHDSNDHTRYSYAVYDQPPRMGHPEDSLVDDHQFPLNLRAWRTSYRIVSNDVGMDT